MRTLNIILFVTLAFAGARAEAAEICGNGIDDDADGLADEGCYPGLTTGVCESPLSCSETGMVAPLTGGLRYQLPADIAPKVPFGPGIGLRRFYTSMYTPGVSAPAWKKPLGDRWQHTYMTWLEESGGTVVLHTSRGQDVKFTYASTAGGWDYYAAQPGFHVQHLRQRTTSLKEFQLKALTGETSVYSSIGRLEEVWDTLATPNKVLVAYDGNGQVSTVTDASAQRRLLFSYAAGQLSTVAFQVKLSGTFTTQHTTTYSMSAGSLTGVNIGGEAAQTNLYSGGYLTQIQDGSGKTIASFSYNTTPGSVARIEALSGTLGYEYSSSRASCSGKTLLYFNLGNTSSCNVDADCGTGFLCGGKTGSGTTGRCFRGARCLTVSSPSEDVITTVTAVGPPSETCEGACLRASQYLWNTGSGALDLGAIQDPSGNYTTKSFNGNGLPTSIVFGDPDSNPTNGNGARTMWLLYDAAFPGKVSETRWKGIRPGTCDAPGTPGEDVRSCRRSRTFYNTDGLPYLQRENGATLSATNGLIDFEYSTNYQYDTKGRVTQIDGPLAGSDDVTTFTYVTPAGSLADNFLLTYGRKKDATTTLTSTAEAYDFWGNPTRLQEPDSTRTCLTFSSARGYLTQRTESMAGQTDCSSNVADLTTLWQRDSALRLTRVTRPDGGCVFYEYDARGRLQRIKRRDDCNASSSGDRREFVYDSEGLVTEIQTYNAAGILTHKQPYAYFDSRKLARVINPVDTSKWTGLTYDSRGLIQQIDAAGGLGRTAYNRTGTFGADGRVTSVNVYKTSTAFDTWNVLFTWLGQQLSITDGDSLTTQTFNDDLERQVRLTSPDIDAPRLSLHDAASRRVTVIDSFGIGAQKTHAFTFDHLGRPLNDDFDGGCGGTGNPPEIQRSYDGLASGVVCPISGGCNRLSGRLAYVRVRMYCSTTGGADQSFDQMTFYSYDDAGRMVAEYITDEAGRIASHAYTWTKSGELATMVTPSGATLGWSYGSAGNNSDSDLVTATYRTSSSSPVVSAVEWNPFGPLKQYNMQSTLSSIATRTRITRNLAYRTTGLFTETQTGGTTLQSTVITEDAKGRVKVRDLTPNTLGVQDSYFVYDDQDRVLCETTSSVSSCPNSGANIKVSHTSTTAPPFSASGKWTKSQRPIPGSTGTTHNFHASASSSHRVVRVCQQDGSPKFARTNYTYDARGSRTSDDNTTQSHDVRQFITDSRNKLSAVLGWYKQSEWQLYVLSNAYDAEGRRVLKTYSRDGVVSTWFFYYDPLGRVSEIHYTPNASSSSVYQVIQIHWTGERVIAYWQTDYPSGSSSRRYVVGDELNRPLEMWTWPLSGDTSRVWAVNPNTYGAETVLGSSVFQPIALGTRYMDAETTAYVSAGATVHRPAILMGERAYDPFSGQYLQLPWGPGDLDLGGEDATSSPSPYTPTEKACPGCTQGTTMETIVIDGTAPSYPGPMGEPGWQPTGGGFPTSQCTRPECLIPGLDDGGYTPVGGCNSETSFIFGGCNYPIEPDYMCQETCRLMMATEKKKRIPVTGFGPTKEAACQEAWGQCMFWGQFWATRSGLGTFAAIECENCFPVGAAN